MKIHGVKRSFGASLLFIFIIFVVRVEAVNFVDPLDLESAISKKILTVSEFKFIHDFATENGFKVYLFGGTAAGFGHYVKWDLLRIRGDRRFQNERFDYDFSNIYRSTQDADLVVDGSEHQAQLLEIALRSYFPHLQGSKHAWEVRLLKEDRRDKLALLKNPDFLDQHTDSHSVGLIEITDPAADESRIKDLREWDKKIPQFFRDICESKLHFYFSDKHFSTKRAANGLNPPIIAVIRYFIKAFQYELEMRPEDLKIVGQIIDEFKPEGVSESYVKLWIIKNARNLIRHAVDIEYAHNTIEQVQLREKLMRFDDQRVIDSLAWWMNKEPLKSFRIVKGAEATAKDLGIDVVAHETRDFLAYESITRSHQGKPNVLISRKDTPGEGAAYGNGFYVRRGREGAVGSRITIRFHMNPNARQGVDFLGPFNDFIVVLNKNALEIIPEYLNLNFRSYLALFKDGAINDFDRGIQFKLSQRISKQIHSISIKDKEILLKEFEDYCNSTQELHLPWLRKAFEFLSRAPELSEKIGKAIEILISRIPEDLQLRESVVSTLNAEGIKTSFWWANGISTKNYINSFLQEQISQVKNKHFLNQKSAYHYLAVRIFGKENLKYIFENHPAHLPWLPSLEVSFQRLINQPISINRSLVFQLSSLEPFLPDDILFENMAVLLSRAYHGEDSEEDKMRFQFLINLYSFITSDLSTERQENFFSSRAFERNITFIFRNLSEILKKFSDALEARRVSLKEHTVVPIYDFFNSYLGNSTSSFQQPIRRSSIDRLPVDIQKISRVSQMMVSKESNIRREAYEYFLLSDDEVKRAVANLVIQSPHTYFYNDLQKVVTNIFAGELLVSQVLKVIVELVPEAFSNNDIFLALSESWVNGQAVRSVRTAGSKGLSAGLITFEKMISLHEKVSAFQNYSLDSSEASLLEYFNRKEFWAGLGKALRGTGVSDLAELQAWSAMLKYPTYFEFINHAFPAERILGQALDRTPSNREIVSEKSITELKLLFVLSRPDLYSHPEFLSIRGQLNLALADCFDLENIPFDQIAQYMKINPEVLTAERVLMGFFERLRLKPDIRAASFFRLALEVPGLLSKLIARYGGDFFREKIRELSLRVADNYTNQFNQKISAEENRELRILVRNFENLMNELEPRVRVSWKVSARKAFSSCAKLISKLRSK